MQTAKRSTTGQEAAAGILTPQSRRRRGIGAAALASCLLIGAAGPSMADAPVQPIASIAAAAEARLAAQVGGAASRTTLSADRLDPRLKLPLCDQPLEGFLRPGTKVAATTIVGVRCSGSSPWKIYVPVSVVVTAPVLVAKQALSRGQPLTSDDFVLEERDVSRSVSGYISDPRVVVGQKLKVSLLAGRALTPAMLTSQAAIRRGQSVTLVANGGGIGVSMAGKALTDGGIGQRIRVENLNSGRVVEGIVRSREHVEVLIPGQSDLLTARPKVSAHSADTRLGNEDR